VSLLLDDATARAAFARSVNPYGDGKASARIVSALVGRPFEEFAPEPLRPASASNDLSHTPRAVVA
jgi:UDP-N-acetylglucosamine 2-epimerase (non-hydrolysing)